MNLFGFEITRRRPHHVLLRAPEMSEREIDTALAVAPTHPFLVALLQLIETARENAVVNAQEAAENPTKMAGYVGGIAHLMMLRDEIIRRRELVAEEIRLRELAEQRAAQERATV